MPQDRETTLFGEVYRLRSLIAKARTSENSFARVGRKDRLSEQETSEGLAMLEQDLRAIYEASDSLGNLLLKPWEKWKQGEQLTREEFYLLAANGVVRIPSPTGTEEAYEEYAHYAYDDNARAGYINESEPCGDPSAPAGNDSSDTAVRVTIGIAPEDVKVSCLRPDQLRFFREHKPELFSRFRRD